MKNCTDCKYAEWDRTVAGRLHPSGDGEVRLPVQTPAAARFDVSSARPASSALPVRALRLTLALEADTPRDMAHALIALAARIERDEVTTGCWGSPSDGAIYELLADPTMTHDAYHKTLREYLDGRKVASNA